MTGCWVSSQSPLDLDPWEVVRTHSSEREGGTQPSPIGDARAGFPGTDSVSVRKRRECLESRGRSGRVT